MEEKKILVRQRRLTGEPITQALSYPTEMGWAAFTWKEEEDAAGWSKVSRFDELGSGWFPYPSKDLANTNAVTIVACGSVLFFISGTLPNKGFTWSPCVYAFDTKKQTWSEKSQIQVSRCSHTATVVREYIFVFGSSRNDYGPKRIPSHQWGELYSINSDEWWFLPAPPLDLYQLYQVQAYAVYRNCRPFSYICNTSTFHVEEKHTLILFPFPQPGYPIYVFDCDTLSWLPAIHPKMPESPPPIYPCFPRASMLHDQLTVVDGVLFWHHIGCIHGYDLINQKYLGSLYTLPGDQNERVHARTYGYDEFRHPPDPIMYFFHPRDHLLLLLFQNSFASSCDMHFHRFVVRRLDDASVVLDHKGYSPICTGTLSHEMLLDATLI